VQHPGRRAPDRALAERDLTKLDQVARHAGAASNTVIGGVEQVAERLSSASSKPGCTKATTGVIRKPVITT